MELVCMQKFLKGIKDANIKKWEAITDIPTHLYNNDNQFNIFDEETESIYNFSAPIVAGTPATMNDIVIKVAHISDVHETRIYCTLDEVKKFLNAIGTSLTSEQMKILVNIQGSNYILKPETGDYTFIEKSSDDIDKMTPEEKEKYEQDKKAWQNRNKQQSPVRVIY